MSGDNNRQYNIDMTFECICRVQNELDSLMDRARRLREDNGIITAERAIERAQDQLVAYRDNYEKTVMKVKPTAKLNLQYERDLS